MIERCGFPEPQGHSSPSPSIMKTVRRTRTRMMMTTATMTVTISQPWIFIDLGFLRLTQFHSFPSWWQQQGGGQGWGDNNNKVDYNFSALELYKIFGCFSEGLKEISYHPYDNNKEEDEDDNNEDKDNKTWRTMKKKMTKEKPYTFVLLNMTPL